MNLLIVKQKMVLIRIKGKDDKKRDETDAMDENMGLLRITFFLSNQNDTPKKWIEWSNPKAISSTRQ